MPPFDFVKDKQKHYIALVGGGGKTTVMYQLAECYASVGKKAVAMTSTHIMLPENRALWAQTSEQLVALWKQDCYGVLGVLEPATGKLVAPQQELYSFALAQADIIICEADGAKRMPVKTPRDKEPVIPEPCDIVIGVVGLEVIGKPWGQVCFGFKQAQTLLRVDAEELITVTKLAALLMSEQGTRKGVGMREYYLVLNKLDLLEDKSLAAELKELLVKRGMSAEHIWLRGTSI